MTTGVDRVPAQTAGPGALADQIVSVVTRIPDVAGLTEMPGSPVATYLPGRKVSGVAVRAGEVAICVVVRYGRPLPEIAAQVRRAVVPLVPGRMVDVVIADITSPDEQPGAGANAGRTAGEVEATRDGEESANG